MRGPRRIRYSQLTSLVDVLFILLFASLVQQRRAAMAANPPAEPVPEPAPTIDAGPPEPEEDLHAEARGVAEQLETDTVILVAVDRTGTIASIEHRGTAVAVDVPLLRATADERVVAYAAVERPDQRLCKLVAHAVAEDLAGALILISTEQNLRDMPYALVRGLRADAARCVDDAGAYALLVRPTDIPPRAP